MDPISRVELGPRDGQTLSWPLSPQHHSLFSLFNWIVLLSSLHSMQISPGYMLTAHEANCLSHYSPKYSGEKT